MTVTDRKAGETSGLFSRNAMHCDCCRKPVPDDVTIWRVSVGYFPEPPGRAVQSWCAACVSDRFSRWHRDWHPEQPCQQCGRPVIFDAARRIPFHAVCGDACRYAIKLAQAGTARRRPQAICLTCGKPFPPRRVDARFCSPPCRQRAYRQRQHADQRPPH
jgi:hypothetical protein